MARDELAFGRFRLQAGRQLFLDGQPVPLGAKPLNILTALVTADGNLVTKDELIERVWPGMVVEENAVQAHISAIRKALGDEARRITTVPGLGYRFCGPLEPSTGAEALAIVDPGVAARTPRRGRLAPILMGIALILLAAIGLALSRSANPPARAAVDLDRYYVLPFANHTGNARFDNLADTLADGVASRLVAQAWDSEVVDRNKGLGDKGRGISTAQLADQLHLTYIVDGGLLPSEGGIQATATIIDARTGTQVASVTTRAEKRDDDAERQLLATGLVDQARYAIGRAQRRQIAAGKPDDGNIRNLLVRAETLLDESAVGDSWVEATGLIDKALTLDPHNVHALCVAGTARIQFVTAFAYKNAAERTAMLDEADRYLSQATGIESNKSVIHMMLGDLRSAQGRHAAARAEYQRVLDLDSLNAEALDGLAMEDIFEGQPEAAMPKLEEALRTNPEDAYLIDGDKAILQMSLDHDAEALAAIRQAVTVDSTDPWAWITLAGLLQITGQHEEAQAALKTLRRINPGITIAKLRLADVNISPLFSKSEERLYVGLRQAGLEEGTP